MAKPSPAVRAAQALADLTVLAVIQGIAEGSFLRSASADAGRKIERICRAEQQKRLADYDAALAEEKA